MAGKHRILVVDDEAVICELMTDILGEEGFDVLTANNGREALNLLQQDQDFVLLFTDIMMPEMDGIELIRHARQLAPNIVAIVMTGQATVESARAAVKEGIYDYLVKPFTIGEIRMAVSNALERARLTSENARLREITDLFNISEKIASMRDEDLLLSYVLDAALDRVGAEAGSVMIVSGNGETLEVAHSRGLNPDSVKRVVHRDDSISGWVAQNVRPLMVGEPGKGIDIEHLSRKFQGGTFMSVPLERKSSTADPRVFDDQGLPKVMAVLNATGKKNGEVFSDTDLKALSIVANHAAAALENVRLIRDIEDNQREVVYTLGEIVETRSKETGQHVKRVAEYSRFLALRCGLLPAEAEVLRMASPLHDVGKVGIPDAILNKPGKLTAEEFEIMKTHAQLGYDMLKNSKGVVLRTASIVAYEHQEKFDGSGYPRGLKGKDIHIYGRITGVADVFDALGTERVYKRAWELDKILEYFREQRGRHFDPDLVDIFFECLDDLLRIRDQYPELGLEPAHAESSLAG
jgi:response regulator RpfG family c-di-GMP phosphodiesterase